MGDTQILPGVGDFFTNVGNAITGKTKADITKQQLAIQEQAVRDALANEIEQQRLKYNPELSKERTKQVAVVVISITIIVGIFIYFRFS